MNLTILLAGIFILGCAKKPAEPVSTEPVVTRSYLMGEKRNAVTKEVEPAKGKFLDYIYQIRPDHKQNGYAISTAKLNNGYAYGSGPYDGAFVEFFLFRGTNSDLVIMQTTGYEVPEGQKYGADLQFFTFKNNKMTKSDITKMWPVKNIDKLFDKQIEKLKKQKDIDVQEWAYTRLVRLPIEGTTLQLKVCQMAAEPPFATQTKCLTVGTLLWNKEKFTVKESKKFVESTESI